MVLLLLKLCCGVESVGWLAGGDIVDVEDMRKQQISRSRRKHRIRRNWRIQSTFLIASMCIPVLSFLLANHGLEPFIKSLSVIEEVSNDVDTRAFVGIQTGKRIKELFQELQNLGSFDIAASCPDFASTYLKNETHLVSIQDELANILSKASPIINEFIPDTIETLYLITKATAKTDEIVDSILSHDWIVIMLLAVVNIINAFFLFGVFLTKNNLDYSVFQAFTGYLLIPVFGLVVIASVGTSCLFTAASISNAGKSVQLILHTHSMYLNLLLCRLWFRLLCGRKWCTKSHWHISGNVDSIGLRRRQPIIPSSRILYCRTY